MEGEAAVQKKRLQPFGGGSGFAALAIIVGAAIISALLLAAALQRRADDHIVNAAFWFEDDVTFDAGREMGPLSVEEIARVRLLATDELTRAFEGLRIRFTGNRRAFYRIRVVEEFPPTRGQPRVAQSRPLGSLGGEGAVSFNAIVARALGYAPTGTDRQAVVDAIGRGIGRTAAHEVAHLLLFGETRMRASMDPASYEYEAPDAAQYYGSMRWDTAWPFLAERLGTTATRFRNDTAPR
jgi:hypothetical protein